MLKILLIHIVGSVILLSFKRNPIIVLGSRVHYLLENDEIFEKCDGHPGNGIHDLFDMSNLHIEIQEFSMHVEGSLELVWDVKKTDRIAIRFEFMKFQRGTWQPTVFNVIRNDFCAVLFSDREMWYDAVMSKVMEEDRQCVNVKGAIYHLEPINKPLTFQSSNNELDGRHKLVLQFEAFDDMGKKRPNSVCAEVKGEFMKL